MLLPIVFINHFQSFRQRVGHFFDEGELDQKFVVKADLVG